MPGRSRQPTPQAQTPATSTEGSSTGYQPNLTFGLPPLTLDPSHDPSVLGNQGMLDLTLKQDMLDRLGGGMPSPNFMRPIPQRPSTLPMPFLDKVPFGGKIRGTVNDWLADPYGKNAPQPAVVEPPGLKREDDPCRVAADPATCRSKTSPTILTTPKIPIPGS